MQSQAHYSPDKLKIVPELLSPEETAQLVGGVFHKLSAGGVHNAHTAFFQAFLHKGGEDTIRVTDAFISRYHDYLGRLGDSALGGVRESRSGSSHDRRLTNLPLQIKQMTTLGSTASTNVFATQALSGTHSHKTLHHPKALSSALQSTAVTSSKANQPYQSIQLKNTASTGSLFGGKGSHENFNSTNNLMSTLEEAQSNVNMLLRGAPPQFFTRI